MEKRKNVLRTFRIEKELWYKFKISCVTEGDIPSVILRECIKDYINKHTIKK
jgi:hypothetical protein